VLADPSETRADDGFTLIETLIVMIMLSIVMGVIVTCLLGVSKTEVRLQSRSQAVDQARLAVQQIERQVRSGNILYTPTSTTMLIYTQANGVEKCVQWKIDPAAEALLVRSWTTTWQADPTSQVSGWRTVASNVVNGQPNVTIQNSGPFVVDSNSAFGGNTTPRLLDIDLAVNANLQATGGDRTVEVQDAVEGRNTQYGFATSSCSTIPPG
jgi:prepilin-type N-terminal cleavage/methylation domain-containing protein